MDYIKIYEEEHLKNGLSYGEIKKKYNINRGSWYYYVRKLGGLKCDQRKYRCNDDFFDVIDLEIKAYLLGFLYADGYIAADGRIGILLAEDDKEIVELIHKYIAPNSVIQHLNYQNLKRKPQVKIRFKSEKLYNRLVEFGFTTDKTHHDVRILEKIPEPFKKDFIRGYTDGDGNVRCSKVKGQRWRKLSVGWCNGVPAILQELQEYFKGHEGQLKQHKSWYTLVYEKKRDIEPIVKHLYTNCEFYLTRKYRNAINIIDYCNNTELTYKD